MPQCVYARLASTAGEHRLPHSAGHAGWSQGAAGRGTSLRRLWRALLSRVSTRIWSTSRLRPSVPAPQALNHPSHASAPHVTKIAARDMTKLLRASDPSQPATIPILKGKPALSGTFHEYRTRATRTALGHACRAHKTAQPKSKADCRRAAGVGYA